MVRSCGVERRSEKGEIGGVGLVVWSWWRVVGGVWFVMWGWWCGVSGVWLVVCGVA